MRVFRIVFLAIAFFFDCHLSLAQICSKDQLPVNLQLGLVAYYPFCGDYTDIGGNGYNGTVQGGAVGFVADRFGNSSSAVQLGGGYITTSTSVFNFQYDQSFSVSLWFTKETASDGGRLLSTECPEGNFRIAAFGGNGSFAVQYGSYIVDTIDLNQWVHLVYTYDNRTEKVYINGSLAYEGVETITGVQNFCAPLTIGAKASSAFDRWSGKADDLAVYNRALSASEVASLYVLDGECASISTTNLLNDSTFSNSSTPKISVASGYSSYMWSNGETTNSIFVDTEGRYSVTITDTLGCTLSDTTFLVIDKQGILASDTLLCSPDTVTLSVRNLVNMLPDSFSEGLVGNYTLDGNSNDLSGNARHLQSFGVTAGSDRFGNANGALVFQNEKKNVTDYLEANNSEPFKFNNYTFSLWLNVSQFYSQGSFWDPSYQGIITFSPEWWNLAPAYNLSLSLPNNSQVGMEHWSSASGYQAAGSTFGALQTGNWYHVIASYDGSHVRMYLNGQILDSSLAQLSYNGQTQFVVGARGDGAFPGGLFGGFNGSMDQLMIWDRALNSKEVQTLFEAQQGGITNQTSILWSTGDTTSTIQVVPKSDTTIAVAIDKDGIVENYSIQLKVGSSEIFEPFSDSTFVKGKDAQLDAGSSYSSYLWNTGDTSATVFVNKSGYYSVSIRTEEGCTLIDSTFLVLNTFEIAADDTILCGPSVTKLSVPVGRGSFKYVGTYGESDYFIDTVHRSWEMSRQSAIDQGMDLWVIDNQEENDSVYSLLPHAENVYANYWIGLFQDKTSPTYSEPSGGWQWVNGNVVTFSNWLGGEPNNQSGWSPGWEDYGIMWTKPFHGKWNDHYGELQDPSIIGLFNVYGVAESPRRKYLWSTGDTTYSIQVTPTADTDYFLTINENGLTFSDTIAIKVVDPLIFNPFADTISVCSDSLLLDVGHSYSSILWNTGDTTGTYTVTKSGFYTIQVKNEFGCISSDTTYLSLVQAKVKQNIYSICPDSTITLSIDSSKVYSSTLMNSKNLFKDLSLYLPFDGKVNDWSSNGNSVLYQQLNLTEDRFGKLNQAFNLSSNPIRVPHSPKISISDSFTFSLWYYPETEFFAQDILMKGYDPEPGAWWLRHHGKDFSENTLNFSHKSDDQVHQLKTASPEINRWHHVVGVFAGNVMKIYIDGLLTDSLLNTSISSVENISDLVIGTNQYSFYGKIDEVSIWQRALQHHEISNLNSSGLKIKWSTGDSSASINVQPNSNTHYVLSVSDGLITCSDTVTVTIVPIDKSLSNLDQDTICVGGSSRLQAGEGSSFIWLRNGTVIDGASSRIHTATAAGSYRVIVTNASGCSDTSAAINITERALPLSGTISSQHPSVCYGTNSTKLTLSGELGSIRWQSSADGLLFSDIPSETGNVYTATNLTSTRYYRVIVTNICGSDTSAVQTVVVNPKPTVSFTVNNASQVLTGNSFVFTNTSTGGSTYLWRFGNGATATTQNATYSYATAGSYVVRLIVTSVAGCQDSTSSTVTVTAPPPPPVAAGNLFAAGTTCAQFKAQTGSALSRLCYTVSSGRVSAVTPSSFMYYVKVTAPSASFTVNISQTVSRTGFRLFTVNTGGSVVSGDNCARVTSVSSPSTGQARASVTRAIVGRTYIIGVRYDTRSLVGYSTNGTLSANYTFVSRIGNTTVSNSTSTVTLYPNNCVGVSSGQLAKMPELGGLPGASAGVDKTGSETKLQIRVYPNPSNSRFNVLIEGSDRQTKGVLRIMNAQGQIVEEIKDVKPGMELQLGMKYTSGTYTAVFIQGNQTTRQRMVRY